MSTTPLHLWIALSRAYAAIAAHAEADVARHGVTLAEFGVLEALYHKGAMRQGDLQRRILVSSGGVTWVVNRLVRRGLVCRRPCPEDARGSFADLTPRGRTFIAERFPDHATAIGRATEGLSAAERAEATTLLKKLGRHAAARPKDERID